MMSPLAAIAPASAAISTTVVINEVYGAGGNSGALYNADFVELKNLTANPVNLAGNYLFYRSAGGTPGVGTTPFALTGSIPANGTWLVQMSAAGAIGSALPTPDQVASPAFAMAAAGGQVLLQTSSTTLAVSGDVSGVTGTNAGLIDMVGAAGSTTFETSPAGTATTLLSLNRNAAGADTDANAADFLTATPTPTRSGPVAPTALEATFPGNKTGQVGVPVAGFTLAATGGTSPYTWTAAGLPAGVTVAANGTVSGTPTVAGTFDVTATATDSATPTPATDDVTFTYTIAAAATLRPIAEIQGTGAASPLVGTNVKTRGIVTAVYPAGGFFGFYIQTPGTGSANIDLATHTASDGVFVRQTTGAVTAAQGDYVEVTGSVAEFAGATQIEVVPAGIEVLSETPVQPVTTTTATWPRSATQKETLEGMRYRPTGDFTVTNTFSTNNFGEVGLASGTKPLIQRTEVELPGPAGSSATEADNLARAVVLDDGASTNFLLAGNATQCGVRPTGCLLNGNLTPPYVSTTDPVRVGAPTTFVADVIFTEGGSPSAPTYRFQPLTTVVGPGNAGSPATFENTRTAAPDEALINEVGQADLKVASFNVLNYFTTLGDANDDNIGDDGCTPFRDRNDDGNTVNGGCDQRGAWDPQDFARQQSKIVAAINALDADVVGLMEIENSLSLGETPDEATDSLVTALNAAAGAGTWAANPSSTELPASGMDVITNAIIYKPASVDRVGQARALGSLSDAGEAFDNAREPLGQVFEADAGGDPFLFVVNHFKSKGSAGPNPGDADSGDGQGASNGSRVLQATALRDWVTGLQTETATDAVVLAGDFNSYAMEDPLRLLYTAGYTDVEQEFENGEYSYSFSGLSGSLDHILVNDAALDRATGTDIWNINGGESLALEYSRWNYHATDFHAAGPYRSSDHDPVILGLTSQEAPTVVTATVSPGSIKAQTDTATIKVVVTAAGTPTGLVTASVDGKIVGGGELVGGKVDVLVGPFATAGTKAITVKYYGDAATLPGEASASLTVTAAPVPPVVKADATVSATVAPARVTVLDDGPTVSITVGKASGTPTGTVLALVDGQVVGAGDLVGGKASITLPPFDSVGKKSVEVRYLGDDSTKPATSTTSFDVVKAEPKLKVKAPKKVDKGEKAEITVDVTTADFTPTGKVTVKVGGETVTKTLKDGSVTIKVRLTKVGKAKVRITYSGDDLTQKASETETITVKRR